jgi:hypothetical protein
LRQENVQATDNEVNVHKDLAVEKQLSIRVNSFLVTRW